MKNVIKLLVIVCFVFSCSSNEQDYISRVDAARKYLHEENYELAAQEFYGLLDEYPENGLVLYGLSISLLGDVYRSDGKTISNPEKLGKSILYLKKALKLFPQNFTIGLTYAAALVDNKEYQEGIEVFESYYELVDQVENDAEAISLRYFEALSKTGEIAQAKKILSDIKQKYPEGMNINDLFWVSMIANFENQ